MQNKLPLAYAAYTLDEEIRNASSSGGIFSELAKYILEQNGVVFGCALDEQMQARHRLVDTVQDLHTLQGSKYVQSDIGETYIQCGGFLKQGRKVLFSGTPCQIEGLYQYLNCVLDSKAMDHLYTQDFICHGVASPTVWNDYMEVQKRKRNANKITDVKFRDKSGGWLHYALLMKFSDGSKVREPVNESVWSRGFLNNLYLRPSCYDCKCKKVNRKSDITLADFWGIERVFPELEADKGVSLMMIHSKKGAELIGNIKDRIYLKETEFESAIKENSSMIKSAMIDQKRRKKFFRVYPKVHQDMRLEKMIVKYTKKRASDRIYIWVVRQGRKVLRKVGRR